MFENFKVVKSSKSRFIRPPILVMYIPIGWFDGSSQCGNFKCGPGGMIKINVSISYKWRFNCGVGTNTHGGLLGVWALLLMVTYLSFVGFGGFKDHQ
jgi:hypothetical protein